MVAVAGIDVIMTGLRETITALTVEVAAVTTRATAGLEAGARIIQAKARENISGHRYEGRVEAKTTVGRPIVYPPALVDVTVGVHGRDFAPEGKTFEFGWRSKKGLQPPVAPLAEWVMRRGITTNEQAARGIAFAIARKMGRSGYSFGEDHWLDDAAIVEGPLIAATVERYIGLD